MMRLVGCVCLLAVLAGAVSAGGQDVKKLSQEFADVFGDVNNVLKSIKDKASAEAAAPKLDAVYDKVKTLHDNANKLTFEQQKELFKEGGAVQTGGKQFNEEAARIEKLFAKDAAVWKALEKTKLFKEMEGAKVDSAKVQLEVLTKACDAHFVREAKFPFKLQDLAQGNPPIIKDAKSLVDPWGQPFHYDPAGPKNKAQGGTGPDIWTVTPTQQTIGNWKMGKKE